MTRLLPFVLSILLGFASTAALGQGKAVSQNESFILFAHFGANGSQIHNDGLGGFDKLNLMGGLGITRRFKERLSAGFELNYLGKGSKKNFTSQNSDPNQYKLSLHYLQVPALLIVDFGSRIDLFGGPALGFLVSARETDFFDTSDITSEFKTTEFSLIVGGAYKLSDNWLCEMRFDQSILPVRTATSGDSVQYQGRQYNTVLGVYLAYIFR